MTEPTGVYVRIPASAAPFLEDLRALADGYRDAHAAIRTLVDVVLALDEKRRPRR
jgi:hypothetical protein